MLVRKKTNDECFDRLQTKKQKLTLRLSRSNQGVFTSVKLSTRPKRAKRNKKEKRNKKKEKKLF